MRARGRVSGQASRPAAQRCPRPGTVPSGSRSHPRVSAIHLILPSYSRLLTNRKTAWQASAHATASTSPDGVEKILQRHPDYCSRASESNTLARCIGQSVFRIPPFQPCIHRTASSRCRNAASHCTLGSRRKLQFLLSSARAISSNHRAPFSRRFSSHQPARTPSGSPSAHPTARTSPGVPRGSKLCPRRPALIRSAPVSPPSCAVVSCGGPMGRTAARLSAHLQLPPLSGEGDVWHRNAKCTVDLPTKCLAGMSKMCQKKRFRTPDKRRQRSRIAHCHSAAGRIMTSLASTLKQR